MNTTSPQKGFRHQAGDRPLDGYTIRRAAGRGGFGEVYFAVSDSGREIALKAIQGFADIELRGIAQCMNLKSPHLVSIFDVRRNDNDEPFVIMEFVNGPSLRHLIDEAPSGLGAQKTAFFLREIAKGLAYLHDCGIVHRDLKPANIFYDEGYVKIGDYGLAKAMSASPQQSQTITVGTVHYMAPEIGGGRYDRSIDIYALGVLVYEMLTGSVPFFGGSPAEILMKHLSVTVDTSDLPAPFDRVVARAMAKDPEQRYATVREMVEDVFGSQHIRDSVAAFGAEDLTVYARRAADKIVLQPDHAPAIDNELPDSSDPETWQPQRDQRKPAHTPETPNVPTRKPAHAPPVHQPANPNLDPFSLGHRLFLSIMTIFLLAGGTVFLMFAGSSGINGPDLVVLTLITSSIAFAHVLGLIIARSWFGDRLDNKPITERLTYGCMAVVAAAIPTIAVILASGDSGDDMPQLFAVIWLACLAPLVMIGVHGILHPARNKRVSLGHPLEAAFVIGVPTYFLLDDNAATLILATISAAISLAAQVLAPFDPYATRITRPTTATDRAIQDEQRLQAARKPEQQRRSEDIHDRAANEYKQFQRDHKPVAAHTPDPRISAKLRAITLLLAAAPMVGIPIFGLHRFYVGKIATGILWLLTGGLFGIGQFLDAIFIVAGHFEDSDEKTIETWWNENNRKQNKAATHAATRPNDHRQTTSDPMSVYTEIVEGAVAGTLAIFAYLALFGAAAITGLTIFGAPYFISADVPGIELNNFGTQLFGEGEWEQPLLSAIQPIAIVLGTLGTILMVLARRRSGIVHMLRAIFGIGLLAIAALFGYALFDEAGGIQAVWTTAAEQVQHGAAPAVFISVMQAMDVEILFATQALVLLGVLLLAWPASRIRPYTTRRGGTS